MQQTLSVTSDITASGHIDMVDDKIIKLGTDDDLQIKYTNSGDASSILDTSTGLTVGGADVQITDAAGTVKFFKGNATNSIVYHNDAARITTSATGINIGGAIDAVTSITGSGDITIATDKFTLASASGNAVFGGTITANGTGNYQLGTAASAKLGIGRAPVTYNLEVEGSIYSTGSSIIAGNASAGKFILQKSVAGIGLHFTDNTGTDLSLIHI